MDIVDVKKLEEYCTRRSMFEANINDMLEFIESLNKTEHKFETVLFLPEGENRQGEGGERKQGYFKKSKEDNPLITVVTVVYNGEKFLEETILSVINQTYDNVEYIIIDGGSTDGTLDIIRKYEHAIDYWISEKDRGISDAFNKAVLVSLGDYINFQGDGDGFASRTALESIIKLVDINQDSLVSAKINRISLSGDILYSSKQNDEFNKKSLLFRMSLPHQGLLTSLSHFKKYGLFEIDNKYCMDYEHLLLAYFNMPNVKLIDQVLANWRADGLGNGRTLDILGEYHRIKIKHKIVSKPLLYIINIWTLFKYYIKLVLKK